MASQSVPLRASADRERGYDLIHARIMRGFPELVRALGGQPAPLLDEVALDLRRCEDESAVTYRQWTRVMERAAQSLGVADFGLRLATRQGGAGAFGPLGAVMRHSRTFGEALSYVARHSFAHSRAARVWKGATASGRHVFIGHEVLLAGPIERSQAVEQLMLIGHLGAGAMTGGRVRTRRVHVRHSQVSAGGTYRKYFGCEVRFCRNEDGVAFLASDMACPLVDSDGAVRDQASALIARAHAGERPPLSAEVRGVVLQWLATGSCCNERAAALLGMHPRTLHRRLVREGTSFQRIKDEVRRELMAYYLEHTALELSEISAKLGFAEQSALSRFAREVLGASPTQVRRRARSRNLA